MGSDPRFGVPWCLNCNHLENTLPAPDVSKDFLEFCIREAQRINRHPRMISGIIKCRDYTFRKDKGEAYQFTFPFILEPAGVVGARGIFQGKESKRKETLFFDL
jgi:hypothetical protein